MAPRFRSRITTGLLMAAAVLPVPLAATTATASAGWSTPVDRPPDLVRPQGSRPYGSRPQVPPDDYAADPPLAGSLAGAGRGHPGRPEPMEQVQRSQEGQASATLTERPDTSFPDLPEHLPESLPAYEDRQPHPSEPPGHSPRPQRPRDPSGAGPAVPSASASVLEPGGRSTDFPDPADSTDPSDADGAETSPSPSASSSPAPDEALESPPRHDLAGSLARRPYEPLPPLQSPTTPEQQPGPAQGAADPGPAATESPYALQAPASRVDRVLPMGAGLALTGLGLAFFGLRLRRR